VALANAVVQIKRAEQVDQEPRHGEGEFDQTLPAVNGSACSVVPAPEATGQHGTAPDWTADRVRRVLSTR